MDLDLAPFALPATAPHELAFELPRDIARLELRGRGLDAGPVRVEYLRLTWPQHRWERAKDLENPFEFGWSWTDDRWNASWVEAAVDCAASDGGALVVTFRPLDAELPAETGYAVTFRRTLGVRVLLPAGAALERLSCFGVAPGRTSRVRLELAADPPVGRLLRLSGWNAQVVAIEPLAGAELQDGALALAPGRAGSAILTVHHLVSASHLANDEPQLTITGAEDAVTLSLTALATDGPAWAPDAGCYLACADDPTDAAAYRRRWSGERTLTQRVETSPEQTLAGALRGQPRPHAVPYSVGCPLARQRFWIEADGDVVLSRGNLACPPSPDLARFHNRGEARWFLGFQGWRSLGRATVAGAMPAWELRWRRDGIEVEERITAVPLNGLPARPSSDLATVCVVRLACRNRGSRPATLRIPLSFSSDSRRSQAAGMRNPGFDPWGVPESPRVDLAAGDGIIRDRDGVLRAAYLVPGDVAVTAAGSGLAFERLLQPGEACDLLLKLPYIEPEVSALRDLDADAAEAAMREVWAELAGAGARISTPEPILNDLHAAHLAHVALTDTAMADGSINTAVGTSTYGNYTNEGCMVVHDLTERGLVDEARRRLAVWVIHQGTVPQPGRFTDHRGMFYGAAGFEAGFYNQHHGCALWMLCEHFQLTGDRVWFAGVAQAVIDGADWIVRQRSTTLADQPASRGWERGFLPAGSLEDVTDFHYWLATNALTWRGLDAAAAALAEAGHVEAPRLRREADAYAADLRRGFDTARRSTPVVRLRDGRWVPRFPSRLYSRGRDQGWVREVLEGSVYLLLTGLYPVDGREAGWILDDFQDNLYVRPPFGYPLHDFERCWFDRGGFSAQPLLLAGLLPHLDRDQPEVAWWMYCNALAACWREEIGAIEEHPRPELGFSNHAHFKTSDQANAMLWLRRLFVHVQGDALHLGRALPRRWLAPGQRPRLEGMLTRFGRIGVSWEPGADSTLAMADLELRRAPGRIRLRFRDHLGRPIRNVSVDGRSHDRFDPVSGDVELTGMTGRVRVEAGY